MKSLNSDLKNLKLDWMPLLKKKYKVSIRQYSGLTSHWTGTKIIFSAKDMSYFYKLIKTQKLDWSLFQFDQQTLGLVLINLCFSELDNLNQTTKLFDEFLVNLNSQMQNHTNTRQKKLQYFPDRKILKVNRRNNWVYYLIN